MSETIVIESGEKNLPAGLLEVVNDLQMWASREMYTRSDNITLDVYGVERRRAVREVMARIAREEISLLLLGMTLLSAVSRHMIFPFAGALSSGTMVTVLAVACLLGPLLVPPAVLCWAALRATGEVSSFIARYAAEVRAVWLVGGAFLLGFFLFEVLPSLGLVDLFYERLPRLGPIPVAEWIETTVMLLKAAAPRVFATAAVSALVPVAVARIRSARIERRKKFVEEVRGSL